MKTKEFIERVESNLFTVRESHDGTIIFIHPSRSDFNILAWVNKYENESHIYSVLPKGLAESLLAYTMTPIEEREEEKKYHVKVNNPILKEGLNEFELYFINYRTPDDYFLSDELEDNEYKTQFTQKEIDNFPDEVKEILPLCKQIEVTP